MSSSKESTADSTVELSWSHCGSRRGNKSGCARWSPINIAGLVVGFMIFWPVGLIVLAWILTGHHVLDLPAAIRDLWSRFFSSTESRMHSGTDNIVFNEYQQTQYDRISEIKNEIRDRARRFADYREDIQRRHDRKEFDRFMANAPGNSGTSE